MSRTFRPAIRTGSSCRRRSGIGCRRAVWPTSFPMWRTNRTLLPSPRHHHSLLGKERGGPTYHPRVMGKVLLYR